MHCNGYPNIYGRSWETVSGPSISGIERILLLEISPQSHDDEAAGEILQKADILL
jgi:hypothetical protein